MSVEERVRRLPWVLEFQIKFVKEDPLCEVPMHEGPTQPDGKVHSYVWYGRTQDAEYGETAPVPLPPADPDLVRRQLLSRALEALTNADPSKKGSLRLVRDPT